MDYQAKGTTPSTIKPVDIVVMLLRRKWLILIFTLLGVGAAAWVYFGASPEYKSEAKLFIRYVLEKKLPTGEGSGTSTRQPSGDNILASEVEVLTSYDLALEVAEKVGPGKIIPNEKGPPDKHAAAMLVRYGVRIDVPKQSDVLRITFQHSDPGVVQPVLKELISSYLRKHDEIHRTSGLFDEVLTEQTAALRAQVAQTEEDLRKLQVRTGISNLEETKKTLTQELSRIRQEINNTQAEMAERQAILGSLQKSALVPTATNAPVTNAPAPVISPQISNQYRALLSRLESLRKREQELTRQFTAENAMVKDIVSQREAAEKQQAEMETEHPELIASVPVPGTTQQHETRSAFDPAFEQARLAALQAKGNTLDQMLQKIVSDMSKVQEAEPELMRLQRKREMEDAQYRQFQASLEQARFEESLGAGRLSNIGVAQTPSPPARESRHTMKLAGMSLMGGLGLGLLLAMALEFFIRPTIKTASELERRMHAPVFLSVPALANGKSHRKQLAAGEDQKPGEPDAQIVPWDPGNRLQPYYEGLRDRIMTWFENQNLTRKPKLVAVSSCDHGAGASSIAAGLAATFSETGDGRVLLVDMNVGQGAAHSFYKGRPGCGLDGALQEGEGRDDAQVNENLFVVAEGSSNSDRLPSVLPRRFTSLVPKLKASDFDYIIFDMPPVSPITITPRLSAYMDLVLVVVEEGRTSPHDVKAATDLLAQSKAKVAAVLNKTKSKGPGWLLQAAT